MRFGVWGLGFGVWGLGFRVWGLGFGVWGLGFGVWGSGSTFKDLFQIFEGGARWGNHGQDRESKVHEGELLA